MDLDKSDQSTSKTPRESSFHEELLPDKTSENHGQATGCDPITWNAMLTKLREHLSLDKAEKIALLIIGIVFIALTLWAGVWLMQKNQLVEGSRQLDLPAEGAHATISGLTSYWKLTNNEMGVKMGAIVVPTTTITLGKHSTSGALRIYFLDANKQRIGDPITISFQDGLFDNASNRVEISATDGFHSRVDFDTYQLGSIGAWSLEVLEAKDEMEPRSSYSALLTAEVSPSLR